MRPQPDDYPEHVEAVARALVIEGINSGLAALSPIAYPPRDIVKKRAVRIEVAARIMKRDGFQCRYCGGRTILTPIMELIGSIYPDAFPFHPNWKGGRTHPAIISRSPAIDHVNPVALGGDNTDENLVTACNPCNTIKSDFTLEMLGWNLRPIEESDWDGLSRYYRHIWEIALRPKPNYHENWMKALEV